MAIALGLAPMPVAPQAVLASPEAAPARASRHGRSAHDRALETWRTLHFRGRSLLARFSAELEMELPPPGALPAEEGGPSWVAALRTKLESRLLTDKSTRLRAHFDPITGVVDRLTQLSMGPRPDFKRYAFGRRGATRIRTEPGPGRALEPPDRWPGGLESFHAYDPEALGCRIVSNPAALAWWLTWGPAGATARSEDPRACYFLGKTLYRIDFEPLGTTTERVDYALVREGRARRRSKRARVEHYSVVSRPIAGKLDEDTIVAKIALDAENRLPWRFEMGRGPLGIDVELDRVVLRELSLVITESPEPD